MVGASSEHFVRNQRREQLKRSVFFEVSTIDSLFVARARLFILSRVGFKRVCFIEWNNVVHESMVAKNSS